ncbi:type II secretion system F family protein [Alkalihalobacillus deserti]|uniref:type II secretion system F family protein n=1 Tax=Alkalihalobacillus deserti TaxID=2879466 RepID=UPI001D15658E|nr:type II secretion system F family protein [Alkalihalobacillus deserti]
MIEKVRINAGIYKVDRNSDNSERVYCASEVTRICDGYEPLDFDFESEFKLEKNQMVELTVSETDHDSFNQVKVVVANVSMDGEDGIEKKNAIEFVTAVKQLVVILLTVVLPSLLANLTSMGGAIPFPTKVVMALSDFLIHQWYIATLFVVAIKRNLKGRYMLDYAKLNVPVFGLLAQKTILARVTRTMASLFASSVPVFQTLTMSSEIAENEVVKKVINELKESLRAGESLSLPLSKSWVFPKLVSHMVKVGEETGQLDTMLEKVADFYEDEVEQMAARMSSIIEPLMIVMLGVIVGTIVLAAILPMFSIYDNFGG